MIKRIVGMGVALLVALGVGWVWGASGSSDINRALRTAELRDSLLEGRAAVLDARLDVYSVNFGEASRHLEAARSALRAADAQLQDVGRQEDAKRLTIALTRIDEAQRLAGQLNQNANALAADAAKTINDVIGSITKDVLGVAKAAAQKTDGGKKEGAK
jgi:Tfp pilus assembly protein PilX